MNISISISLVCIALAAFIQFGIKTNVSVLIQELVETIIMACPMLYYILDDGDLYKIGSNISNPTLTFSVIIFFSLLAILVNYKFAGNPENTRMYPQVRSRTWGISLVLTNVASWSIYIFFYELLFIGYFFFISIENYGAIAATLINVIVYAAAHLLKGRKESLLSVPFGLLLCLITWYTMNFWSAAAIHLTLALSNDFFAFRANPYFNFRGFHVIPGKI